MTSSPDIERGFQGLWRRALNETSLQSVTEAKLAEWAGARGLAVDSIERREVGAFAPIPALILSCEGTRACFPQLLPTGDPHWESLNGAQQKRAALWDTFEWFEPLWLPRGRVNKLLQEADGRPNERAIEIFNYHCSTLYTIPFEAICVAQLMPQCACLQEFCPLVREAFLAFYSGSQASSIAALIPVVEGALTRIAAGAGGASMTIPDRVNAVIERAVQRAIGLYFDGMWAPAEYKTTTFLFPLDERVMVFETFRRWLLNSFFRNTSDYGGATWLNRHLFAHGASSDWQQSANFMRLLVALTTIGFVEEWSSGSQSVSVHFPQMDEDGKLLWQQALFQGQAQLVLKQLAEKQYHEHGRLVPELPADDGALLRRALLADDCIKDLVRPLRDAGWNVEVGEVEEKGLHVVVRASAQDATLTVALLYSCATGNDVYRNLAQTVDVILYRGAPHHQEQYAYGLNVHVGPVAGWQPPRAQGRTPSAQIQPASFEERVRERAYLLWRTGLGRGWWNPEANWLEAEVYEREASALQQT